MIVITTPTGNIGSQLVKILLHQKQKLRLVLRDPSKLPKEIKDKVEIVEGSLDDFKTVSQGYKGADQLFFVVPPSMSYTEVNDYYMQFSNPTCKAILEQNVRRVVFVSGTGLGFEKKAGPVSASYLVEEALMSTGVALRILHCGTFMENLIHSVPSIKHSNQFSTSVPSTIKCPWVATQDIAAAGAKLLLDTSWLGQDSLGVLGPEDLSYGEIAEIINKVLKKNIQYNSVSSEELKNRLNQYGATPAAAQGLVDIYSSMTKGVFNRVPRTHSSTTPTAFNQWCENVLRPLF